MLPSTPPKASAAAATAVSLSVAAVIPVFLFGGLAVQISDELDMSASAIGLVSSAYFGTSCLTTVVTGRLVERLGAITCARIAITSSATAMLAIAAFAHTTALLIAFLLLATPANNFGQLASNAILSRLAPAGRKGLMFGLKQSSVPLSTLLAGLAVPAIALTLGWRWAFVAGAAVALLAFIPLAGLGPAGPPATRRPERIVDTRLVLLGFATFASAAAATPVGSFLTSYAVELGASEAHAGVLLTAGGLTGVIARTAAGALGDLRPGREFGMIAIMLVGGTVGCAAFLTGSIVLLPVATVCSFALGWAWPGLMNFAVTQRYPQAPAAATSITQTGIFLGGAVAPLAFGLIVDRWGWNSAWSTMLVAMSVAAVFVLAASRIRPRTEGA